MLDFKSRLKNKTFLVAMFSALLLLANQLGLTKYLMPNISDVFNTVLLILVTLGIVIDPSTTGILDKKE